MRYKQKLPSDMYEQYIELCEQLHIRPREMNQEDLEYEYLRLREWFQHNTSTTLVYDSDSVLQNE